MSGLVLEQAALARVTVPGWGQEGAALAMASALVMELAQAPVARWVPVWARGRAALEAGRCLGSHRRRRRR